VDSQTCKSRVMDLARVPLFCVLFLTGFSLGLAFLNIAIPSVSGSVVQAKLEWLKQHGDEIDTLMIGSSHVHHQISPIAFDKHVKECGDQTRSFNLGCYGMVNHEMMRILREVLAEDRHFKNVFIAFGTEPPATNYQLTQRAIWWHDFTESFAVVGDVLVYDAPLTTKWTMIYDHLLHASLNIGRIGRWKLLLDPPALIPETMLDELSLTRGYSPIAKLAGKEEEYDQQRKSLTDHPDRFEATRKSLIAQLEGSNAPGQPSRDQLAALRDLQRLIQILDGKCEQIFLFTPVGYGKVFPDLMKYLKGEHVTHWTLNDPTKYPGLYDTDKWGNLTHLNQAGADEFTDVVAAEYCDYLKTGAQR